jgi:hypothetical protein
MCVRFLHQIEEVPALCRRTAAAWSLACAKALAILENFMKNF